MNRFLTMSLWISLFLTAGCGENIGSPDAAGKGCYTGKVLKTLKNQRGRIVYDSTEKKYVVYVSHPGTYDSVDAGFLCDNLEVIEKEEGLTRIVFDGKYFLYNQNRVPEVAGTKYYYLKITEFEVIK